MSGPAKEAVKLPQTYRGFATGWRSKQLVYFRLSAVVEIAQGTVYRMNSCRLVFV